MMITKEMMAEDEKNWNDRNIVAELGYCGKNIRHRKNITNNDIRFYAYIMRKAHALLKEQELQNELLMKKCIFCTHCKNCDVDDNGSLKEQETKEGRWVLEDEDENSWKCSECGGFVLINDGTPHENDWQYCPYCGAKLDEQVVKCND